MSSKTEEIGKIVEELKKIEGVVGVYLFGSMATGKQKKYSDIDICVITRDETDKEDVLSYSGRNIDISIFHDLPLTVQFKVFKEGIPLFVGDEETVRRLKAETLKKYLDFKPILERRLRRLLL
jgi:predicted nucleotidyltransferase